MCVFIIPASHASKQVCNFPLAINVEKKDVHILFSPNPTQSCWAKDSEDTGSYPDPA